MGAVIDKVLAYMNAHLGDKYSKTYRMKKGKYDCSSFVYRAYLEAAGIKITHKDTGKAVSTSCYEVYAKGFKLIWPAGYDLVGKSLPSAAELIPSLNLKEGAHIFYCMNSKTTRANKITHVSTVNKNGSSIIHARNVKKGVCVDPLTYGSTRVCAVIQYIEDESVPPVTVPGISTPTLKRVLRKRIIRMKGSDVKAVQEALIRLGFAGNMDVTKLGTFGAKTEAAVKLFQKARGLHADGKVGKQTAPALGIVWVG
ncbi:MAG: C40 family peptidase [Christensenellales bacterium]